MMVPKVYRLSSICELAVLKLVHSAAVRIEDECDAPFPLVDAQQYGVERRVRIYDPRMQASHDQLIEKLQELKTYLSEQLLPHLLQQILRCAYFIMGSMETKYFFDYETMIDIEETMVDKDRTYANTELFVNSYINKEDCFDLVASSCFLKGRGELVTFAVLTNVKTDQLHIMHQAKEWEINCGNIFTLGQWEISKFPNCGNKFTLTQWSQKTLKLFRLMFESSSKLRKLQLNHVTNEVLELVAQLSHLENLSIDLERGVDIENGLLALCGKKICGDNSHNTEIDHTGKQRNKSKDSTDEMSVTDMSSSPWMIMEELKIRRFGPLPTTQKRVPVFIKREVTNKLHEQAIITSRLEGLAETGTGCMNLQQLLITSASNLSFLNQPKHLETEVCLGCGAAALMMFLPKLQNLNVVPKLFIESSKHIQAFEKQQTGCFIRNEKLSLEKVNSYNESVEIVLGTFPETENITAHFIEDNLFCIISTYIRENKLAHLRNVHIWVPNIELFSHLIQSLKMPKFLESLGLQFTNSKMQKFKPQMAIKISENLPRLKKVFIKISDICYLENTDNKMNNLVLSKSSVENYRAEWDALDYVVKSNKEEFQLQELRIDYTDCMNDNFDFNLLMALLHKSFSLKRLTFESNSQLRDEWLIPIIASIKSWKSMEIFNLNTGRHSQYSDSDSDDSDSSLEQTWPSIKSLELLVDAMIAEKARNMRLLRGDWKVSKQELSYLEEKLAQSGITPSLIVNKEEDMSDEPEKIIHPKPVQRDHPNFLANFPYLLSPKCYIFGDPTSRYFDCNPVDGTVTFVTPFFDDDDDQDSPFMPIVTLE